MSKRCSDTMELSGMYIDCSPGDGVRFGLELIPETENEEELLRQLEPLLMSVRFTVEKRQSGAATDMTHEP